MKLAYDLMGQMLQSARDRKKEEFNRVNHELGLGKMIKDVDGNLRQKYSNCRNACACTFSPAFNYEKWISIAEAEFAEISQA